MDEVVVVGAGAPAVVMDRSVSGYQLLVAYACAPMLNGGMMSPMCTPL
jgi:hypothetical protein